MKDFECTIHDIAGESEIKTIDLIGGIFTSNISDLKDKIDTLKKSKTKNIILNCKELYFIGGDGIGLIVQKHEELRDSGKRLWVAELNSDIVKVFEQFSLENILFISDNEQQAVEKIKQIAI
jgi:anti-anti-sigma factor